MGVFSSSLATMGDELGSTIRKAFRTNTHNMFAGSVMVTQPLYMGGSINAMNRVAELNVTLADNNYDMLQQNVLYEIDATYWLVVSLRQKQKLAQNYLDLVTKLHDDVYKMIDKGVAIRADGLNMDVRVTEAEMAKMRVDDNLALVKMLNEYRRSQPLDIHRRLFPRPYGTYYGMKAAMKTIDSRLSPHCLRHTYATHLLAKGMDIRTVAALLGDNVKTVINTYIHYSDDMRTAAANDIEKIFAGNF